MPKKGYRNNRVGEKYITNQGYEVEIIKYDNFLNCTVNFTHNNFIVENVRFYHVKNGAINNPYHKSVCGIGYLGEGIAKTGNKFKVFKVYDVWRGLLRRCYNEKAQSKNRNFSYKDCSVAEEWHNFQNFAKWFEENYNPETMQGWDLDKDILVKGNKTYSSNTCTFVPPIINKLFIKRNRTNSKYPIGVRKSGKYFSAHIKKSEKKVINLGTFKTPEEAFQAYKTEKEKYIKEVADKWKNLIDPRVYEALYKYEV